MSAESQPARRLTVNEAAEYFNRHPRTIQRWCQDGTLILFKCRVIREQPGCWLIVIPEN